MVARPDVHKCGVDEPVVRKVELTTSLLDDGLLEPSASVPLRFLARGHLVYA
jgi:hypothetical protein